MKTKESSIESTTAKIRDVLRTEEGRRKFYSRRRAGATDAQNYALIAIEQNPRKIFTSETLEEIVSKMVNLPEKAR